MRGARCAVEPHRLRSAPRAQAQPVASSTDWPRRATDWQDIYFPRSKYQGNIDGAFFGTTFPHLFLMTYGTFFPFLLLFPGSALLSLRALSRAPTARRCRVSEAAEADVHIRAAHLRVPGTQP